MLLAALLLYALAWQLTRQGIDRQARDKAAIYQSGHTPWDFAPHTVDDLIAGRAFGQVDIIHDDRGLIARSRNGQAYELGVPLPYPVDLRYFPVVRLGLDSEGTARLQWLIRARLDGPLLVSGPLRIAPGDHELRVDFRTLHWSRASTGKTASMPHMAAMLRLKLRQSPDNIVRLRALHWHRAKQDSNQLAYQVRPWSKTVADSGLATSHIPVFLLKKTRVEGLLAQRDSIRQDVPSAVVVASPDAIKTSLTQRSDFVQSIAGLLAYGLILLLTWKRTRRTQKTASMRRVLPVLQIAVCAGPLLVFAIGMYGSPGPSLMWLGAMSAGMAFALWLAWRGYAQDWCWLRWNGRMAWSDWSMPALTTVAAAGLLLVFAVEPHLPSPRRMIGYALWAGLQQLLILAALAPGLRSYRWPRWLCALGLAIIFALAHAPNAMLMELTLLAELLWAWQFLRRPVLLPIILAHAAAGLILAMGIADLPLRSLEVGARFLQ